MERGEKGPDNGEGTERLRSDGEEEGQAEGR